MLGIRVFIRMPSPLKWNKNRQPFSSFSRNLNQQPFLVSNSSSWSSDNYYNCKHNVSPHTIIRSFSAKDKAITQESNTGLTVAILGPTNAGKSTLFNRLMCKESNRSYRLSSEKKSHKAKRSRGRIGSNNNPSSRVGGAIVSSTPGTTRDRRECIGRIGGTYFALVDTAGVDSERIDLLTQGKSRKDPMEVEMMKQTLEAARNADLIFLMFDAKIGVTTDLAETCRWLRKVGAHAWTDNVNKVDNDDNDNNDTVEGDDGWKRKVVILANKLEGDAWSNYYDESSTVVENLSEVSRMGFGEAIPISAEHGEGLADMGQIIADMTAKKHAYFGLPYSDDDDNNEEEEETEGVKKEKERPLRLAILGRQNVGKSTLVNALLKQDRVIAGDKPGLTRDAIAVNWSWNGRPVHLVDTAGIRRMAKRDHTDNIEDLAVRDAMRAMKVADVAVLILDAEAKMLQRQELAIADAVVREGRCLVVVANKMDLLVDAEYSSDEYAAGVRQQVEGRFPMLRSTPVVAMSSLTGECVEDLMPVVFNARDRWSQVINTALLNRWMIDVVEGQSPPMVNGRQAKIKYIMQTKGRPPTFLLFCNVEALPASYMRYLNRNFQETFGMFGMEVRMAIKTSTNPYHDKNDKKRGGMGVGGRDQRKARMIAELKSNGKPKKKGVRRRMQRR
eukprot:scaffold1602_cov249-Chaetoceros_neogracile.AAC.6